MSTPQPGQLPLTTILADTLRTVAEALDAEHDDALDQRPSHADQLGRVVVLQARALETLLGAYERAVRAAVSRDSRRPKR